ncbi:MAG: SDR family NAD(P)-dependent oxidoreductase [Bacteroidetes bacterium]|nr:SDR family NAD(P)-dependent oxidoreductase [Bacteroidota bacterium]
MKNINVAIVTGATGNLGKSVTHKFLDEGFYVVGTTTVPNNNLPIQNYEEVVVDLSDETASEKFIENIINRFKKIDVAVLTAGGFAMGKVVDLKATDIKQQIQLNFETAYNVAQPIFKQMLNQKNGRIFFIGSKAGLDARNSKGVIAYGLSKSLIFRLAELMNEEAQGKNVVANVVVPSTIDTPPNRKAMPGADFDKWVKTEAIASVIYWHCTEEAASLRESIIKVYNNA